MTHLYTDTSNVRALLIAVPREEKYELYEQLSALSPYGLEVHLRLTKDNTADSPHETAHYDAILLDLEDTDYDVETLPYCVPNGSCQTPIIVFVQPEEEWRGVAAVNAGANDYILKGECTGRSLARCVAHAIGHARPQSSLQPAFSDCRTIVDSASAPSAVLAYDGSINQINRHMEELLGLSCCEVEGRMNWNDIVAGAESRLESITSLCRDATATPVEIQTKVVHRSGQVTSCRFRIVPAQDHAGLIVTGVAAVEGQESAYAHSNRAARIAGLFDSLPGGVVSFDRNGLIIEMNPAFEHLFDVQCSRLLGTHVMDCLMPAPIRPKGERLLKALLRGEVHITQTTTRRSCGSELVVSITGAPIIIDGILVGGLCMCQDITESAATQELLEYAFIDLVETTLRAVESVDPYTAGHQRRMARLADIVGRQFQLDDERLQGLYVGSMLHDIGKLSLPSTILTKPGRLSIEEWDLIKSHSRRGHAILSEANLPWPVMDMALRHHERLDGSGYPDGLSADDLSLEVRIIGVCDVVEAMTSDRPYRPALGVDKVMAELNDGCGSRYDERVVHAVLQAVESGAFQLDLGYRNEARNRPGFDELDWRKEYA